MLCNAFLRLDIQDEDFFKKSAISVMGRIQRCKTHEISSLIHIFSKSGMKYEATLNALVARASSRLHSEFTRSEICVMLPALAKLPVQSSPVFEILSQQVSEKITPTLNASETQALFCAYAKCESRKIEGVVHLLLEKIQEHNETYGPQEALTIFDALTRAHQQLPRPELNAMYKLFEYRVLTRVREGGVIEIVSLIAMLSRDPDTFTILPNMIKTCRTQLRAQTPLVTQEEFSTLLTALSRPCCKVLLDQDTVTSLLEQCQKLIPECRAMDIASMLTFLTSGDFQAGDTFITQALQVVETSVPEMNVVELSITANSLSRMNIQKEPIESNLWTLIDERATKLKHELSSTQIGGLFFRFCTCSTHTRTVF